MFGVVLWSDNADRKAVIWCEDHGDLAFFQAEGEVGNSAFSLDAGDLVQFEMTQDRHMRYARNPRVVAEHEYPALVPVLKAPQATTPAQGPVETGTVVPFARPMQQDLQVMSKKVLAH